MNQRTLSERLEELATRLQTMIASDDEEHTIQTVIDELRKLSTENYVPGNSLSWKEIKPKANKTFTDKSGRNLPF